MKKMIGLAVVAAALVVAGTAPAQAHNGYGFGTVGYGSFGQLGSPYALGRIPVPPYFALHPPVYYSQPVARTYGHSPFAYPATVQTPAPAPQAKMVENPHVTPVKKKQAKPDFDVTVHEVVNPYVTNSTTRVVGIK